MCFKESVDLVVKYSTHLPDPGLPAKIFASIRHVVGRLAKRNDLSGMSKLVNLTQEFANAFAESPGIRDDRNTHELIFKHFYTVAAKGDLPNLKDCDFVDRYKMCCSGVVNNSCFVLSFSFFIVS